LTSPFHPLPLSAPPVSLSGERLTIYGDGKQSGDFIRVPDAVEAVILALRDESGVVDGESFNVGAGKATSVNVIAETVSRVFYAECGKKVGTVNLPPRRGEPYVSNFCYSIAKIGGRLSFKPERSIEKNVRQLIAFGKGIYSLKESLFMFFLSFRGCGKMDFGRFVWKIFYVNKAYIDQFINIRAFTIMERNYGD
jgi:hypothetical protein